MKYKHFPAPFFNHFIQPSPPPIAKLKSLHGVLRGQLPPQKWSHPFVVCPPHDNFKISHRYVNLKQPYNQDIKEQVTPKIFLKKKTGFTWNSQPQRHSVEKMFSNSIPICGVNFQIIYQSPRLGLTREKLTCLDLWSLLFINSSLAWSDH